MHIGETPGFDRYRVASEPTYNLATGTQILAGKWRATRHSTSCAPFTVWETPDRRCIA